jgi:colicin import membrane protein
MTTPIRVQASDDRGPGGDGRTVRLSALTLSLVCHLAFLAAVVFTPGLRSEKPLARSVINVRMVALKTPGATAAPAPAPAVMAKAPKVTKPEQVKPPVVPVPNAKPDPTVVPTAPAPKPKTSLKKKTFKSAEVVKQAMQDLEAKVDRAPDAPAQAVEPDRLQSALERLRKAVGTSEAQRSAADGETGETAGGFSQDGRRSAELIDLYRLEVAFQIQKNWAFNPQLAGEDQSLVTAIVFKVMPDGEIRDIFFTDRSGNTALDESAYRAIVKSNPVDRHPNGLRQPYVMMAIRFTPQGIR